MKGSKLLTISMLQKILNITRQGVHQKIKRDHEFPKPVQRVSSNRVPLFLESDIQRYQKGEPAIKHSHNFPIMLTIIDLSEKWNMSRQAIHIRMKKDSQFPKPVQIIFIGTKSVPLFLASDVEVYEERNPTLLDGSLRSAQNKWMFKRVVANRD